MHDLKASFCEARSSVLRAPSAADYRARGIIRRKLIYNQLFKLAIAFGGPVWIVNSFESFFSALLYESDLLYSGGGGKKAKFCGAIPRSGNHSPQIDL